MSSINKPKDFSHGSIYGNVEWEFREVKGKGIISIRQGFYQISFDLQSKPFEQLLGWLKSVNEFEDLLRQGFLKIEKLKEEKRAKRLETPEVKERLEKIKKEAEEYEASRS